MKCSDPQLLFEQLEELNTLLSTLDETFYSDERLHSMTNQHHTSFQDPANNHHFGLDDTEATILNHFGDFVFDEAVSSNLSNIPSSRCQLTLLSDIDFADVTPDMSFKTKKVRDWNSSDVVEWIYWWASDLKLEAIDLNIPQFTDICGRDLMKMECHDFVRLEPEFGRKMYLSLQCLIRHHQNDECKNTVAGQGQIQLSSWPEQGPESWKDFFSQVVPGQNPCSATVVTKKVGTGRRGRPPKKDGKSRNRQGKGYGKLWEFIRNLLLSPLYNPSHIRWERREEGIFKFVQSDKVAKLWGERKRNSNMTYEKMSRAMRTYYNVGILAPVPKNEGLPKKLVYKFGPRATGWR
ncbi:ETS-related transcription factor Elf-5-like isoform X2 [Limulus polyphemus]|uniref:ETS-related transcription factor Elf-5-like isoform X2 n=1 Tax=Limulus polyphemus TaxID=6850 RepID=A0ABM1SBK2_LIMPO|nr:ETS-related transcription factor Elf-5-like isoform X2 [Limulus polyphemus]